MKLASNLSMDQIFIPEHEMRSVANLENLDELTQSILECGVINPITVREIKKDKYEIVAGVRRYLPQRLQVYLKFL